MPHGPHGHRVARSRRWIAPGVWEVQARVERFVEPALLLLLLRKGPTHGYELAESLGRLAPEDQVDYGNLYRLLRGLEYEGVVRSEWQDDLPGRSKRTYELTPKGRNLLDAWAEALRRARDVIGSFLTLYDQRSTR
ncbi:MAG TPA: PadR family transcriptional regulator [Acidimicrobiia bacterium]